MNANTIKAFKGGTGRNEMAALTGDLRTAAVPAAINTNTVGTTAQALLSIPLQTDIIGSSHPRSIDANGALLGPAYGRAYGTPYGSNAPYFNSASFDGIPFKVRIAGGCTTTTKAGQTLQIILALGSGVLVGANTILAQTTAYACATAGRVAFSLVAELIWDSLTQYVSGRFSSEMAYSIGPTRAVISDVVVTNQAAAAAASNLVFQAYALTGQTDTVTLQFNEFSLEQV
jgi:hypothetical protein